MAFCISFYVVFSMFVGNMSRKKEWKNCAEIEEVRTYGTIDVPSTSRGSVGAHHRMKKIMLKQDQGILTKCAAMGDLNGPSPPRRTVLHIHHL